ncbi:transposase for insertion sequence element IS402 domain protein [Leptospira weilii str. LNT 1234]|nr:transposase for insertion sequence element IS402 domain protein [Leptospira weilii str. LNT 1234]
MGLGFDGFRNGQGSQRGSLTGKNPTDRAKLGVKRHILTDGNGIPLAITSSGANVHDKRNVKDTLNSILVFSGRKEKTKTPLFR